MSKKENDILTQARRRFNSARTDDKKERLLADEDTRFAINDDGCQWDSGTRTIREGATPPRPCLVMNKIPEKIDQTEGEFRQLRPSIKVKAVDNLADPKIAEVLSGIIRHIEYNSMARVAYNTSHSSVLNSGRGAWRIGIVDSEDDPFEQDVIIDRIPNVLSVTWDQAAKKIDKSDGNFMFVSEDMPKEDFKKAHPDASLEDWPDEESYKGWKGNDTVRVCEYWWKEEGTKEAYRVERNGTQVTVWKQKEGDKLIDQKTVKHPKVRWCKMVANKILEGPFDDWPSKYIPIILEFGKETNVNGKTKTRGMVRFAKQPQQMYNYWTSSEAEQIALAPKSPYLLTPAMMGPHQAQWDSANTQNYLYLLHEWDPKAPGVGPRREPPPLLSQAMVVAKQSMEHDIMSAMNVYRASLGDDGQEVSGIAIQARQRQGSIGGYSYTDNFEYALIHSAKVLIDIIPHVYESERIIRIRGESDTEHVVPINARPDSPMLQRSQGFEEKYIVETQASEYINDITIGKYDVVATIGPAYTTQREESLDTMIRVIENMPQLAAVAPDLIVGLLDMPMSDELLERAKKLVPPDMRTLEPGEEPPQPPGPTPEEHIKLKELELKGLKEMREGFEGKIDSMAKLMTAEAKEQGQQLAEISAFVQAFESRMQMEQQNQQPGGM